MARVGFGGDGDGPCELLGVGAAGVGLGGCKSTRDALMLVIQPKHVYHTTFVGYLDSGAS